MNYTVDRYLVNIFFSRRVRGVFFVTFVRLGNFFFKRLPFVGIVKSTPVAAFMSASSEGSCQSGTVDLRVGRTDDGSIGCPASSRATIGP